eukprot:7985915-Alexandrium_andersonii.AAC.1
MAISTAASPAVSLRKPPEMAKSETGTEGLARCSGPGGTGDSAATGAGAGSATAVGSRAADRIDRKADPM